MKDDLYLPLGEPAALKQETLDLLSSFGNLSV